MLHGCATSSNACATRACAVTVVKRVQVTTYRAKMLHTIACSLLLAAAAWPAPAAAATDIIDIPYEVEADGTVPFVDLSGVSELPITTPSRSLLSLSATRKATSNNGGTSRTSSGKTTEVNHTKSSSSVKCTASASSNSFAASRDAHADAVAYAVKKGCAVGKLRKKWLADVRYEFKERAGYAIAAVRTRAVPLRCMREPS